MYQLLKDAQGTSVAEISIFTLPAGQQAVAGATIVAPLETLLTEQLTITVDGASPKSYPFSWCSRVGCIARVGFTQDEVDSFKKGAKATMTIVPLVAPDQKVNLDISLKGFTAAFEAVAKTPAP
jgi:invasion protein IalB